MYLIIFVIFDNCNSVLIILEMNRIKEVLEAKGIKQTWLADKLGKSFNMVNAYAQNRRQPSLEVLYKIAELLSVEARDLLMENNQLESSDRKIK